MASYGDVVIHPTKAWPWLGTIRPTGVARICSKCDEIVRVDEYGASGEEKEQTYTCEHCGEHLKSDCGVPLLVTKVQINGGSNEIDVDQLMAETGNIVQLKVSVAQNNTNAAKVGTMKSLIGWYPSSATTEPDGFEKQIVSFAYRYSFQEGNIVSKKDSKMFGLVKQVKRTVDAFVLPDFEYVVRGLKSNRFEPVQLLDHMQHCYVIYNGWVGLVYKAYNRVHFRLRDDGSEFYVDEKDNLMLEPDVGEYARHVWTTSHPGRLFPGQKVKFRWNLLKHAIWADGREGLDETLKAKIEKSEKYSNLKRTVDNCVNVAIETTDVDMSNGKFSIEAANELIEKVIKSLPKDCLAPSTSEKGGKNDETGLATDKSEDEFADGIVTKIEPIKINVDWIARVIPDDTLGENYIKSNIVEGEEMQNLQFFHVGGSITDVFELGNQYKCKINPNIDLVESSEVWRKRFFVHEDDTVGLEERNQMRTLFSNLCGSNDYLYVSEAFSISRLHVLWEDGRMEFYLDPQDLVAQSSHTDQGDRDFFPAMYVYMSDPPSDANGDAGNCSEQGKIVVSGSHNSTKNNNKCFGIVRRANNQQKFAFVDWFKFDKEAFANAPAWDENQFLPVFFTSEEVSFYELKFNNDYNYIPGTLVMFIKPGKTDAPNVGQVKRKEIDGRVIVIWYNGTEETTDPWRLKQLKVRTRYDDGSDTYSDYDQKDCYSPSEHEYDYLDIRSYNYSSLSEAQRNKRIALVITILGKIIPCSLRVSRFVHNCMPSHERKRLLKLCISLNDVLTSLSTVSQLSQCFKNCYQNETEAITARETKYPSCPGMKAFRNSIRKEKLIWQCVDRIYDWIDCMKLLIADVNKFQPRKNPPAALTEEPSSVLHQKKQSTQNERKISVVLTEKEKSEMNKFLNTGKLQVPRISFSGIKNFVDNSCQDTEEDFSQSEGSAMSGSGISVSSDEPMKVDDAVSAEIEQALSEIKVGLTLITGIYAMGSSSDIVTDSIREFLGNCDNNDSFVNSGGRSATDTVTADCVSLSTSHQFLLILLSNTEKASRFPCFSFIHRSDDELASLKEKWECAQKRKPPSKCFSLTNCDKEQSFLTSEQIVAQNAEYLESVFDNDLTVNVIKNGDIFSICNNIADALCLSSLSVMNHLVCEIASQMKDALTDLFKDVPPTPAMTCETASSATRETQAATNNDLSQAEIQAVPVEEQASTSGHFEMLPNAPESHRFFAKLPSNNGIFPKSFYNAINKEIRMLQTCLPEGIYVKTYEDRIDLFSCMVIGPQGTPYADGLFFFDIRLRDDYPNRPPHVFFKSLSKTLNPNLYEDGMVCLSLLGTWDGQEVELWSPASTLLQVFVSIQSLILVPEPYFNEPGYEKQKGTPESATHSRDYNEMAVLRTLESLRKAVTSPLEPFEKEVLRHLEENGHRISEMLKSYQQPEADNSKCTFPLFPATQGFRLAIKRYSENLLCAIQQVRHKRATDASAAIVHDQDENLVDAEGTDTVRTTNAASDCKETF